MRVCVEVVEVVGEGVLMFEERTNAAGMNSIL